MTKQIIIQPVWGGNLTRIVSTVNVGTYRLRRGSIAVGVFGGHAARDRPGGPPLRTFLLRDLAGRLRRYAADALGWTTLRSSTGAPRTRPPGAAVARDPPVP